jgi:hypothetical protein
MPGSEDWSIETRWARSKQKDTEQFRVFFELLNVIARRALARRSNPLIESEIASPNGLAMTV